MFNSYVQLPKGIKYIYIYDCGWLDAQCLVGPEYFAQFVYKPTEVYVGLFINQFSYINDINPIIKDI